MAGMGRRGASEGPAGDRASEVRTASSATPPVDMVLAWADGRTCVWCGSALTESRLAGHHIALLEPGGMTRQWVDVPEAQLPLALATCLPLCWNCDLAATFRRLHPELVTDRDERSPHDRGH